MKKVFLSFMMIAAAMMSFTSCSKSDDDNSSISNAFKLDGSTYDLGYAVKTNVDVLGDNCTMLVLSKSESDISNIVGFIFDGTEIQTGDIDLALNPTAKHPVLVAMTGNGSTSIEEMIGNAYFPIEGSAKITVNENKIIITTSGVKMTNVDLAQSGKTVDFELAYDGSFVIPTPPTPPSTATFTIDGESHNIEFAGQVAYPLGEQIFSIAFFCEGNPLEGNTNVVALIFPENELPTGEFNVHIDQTTMLSNMAYMTDFSITDFMTNPMAYLPQAFMGTTGNLSIQNNEGTLYNITSTGVVVANSAGTTHNLAINFDGELVKLMK